MGDTKLIKPDSAFKPNGEKLAGELNQLLTASVSAREACGATHDIRAAYIRGTEDWPNSMPEYPIEPDDCGCSCESDETCDLCDPDVTSICSVQEAADYIANCSYYKGLGNLLANGKAGDFISLVEHAYAAIGNKPFNLKSNKKIEITDEQIDKMSQELYESVQGFIDQNDVRVTEIPYAFNFKTMSEMVTSLERKLMDDSRKKNDDALAGSEEIIERIFNRTNFMKSYIEVIKDTADYPIGVLWINDEAITKTKVVTKSGVKMKYMIQSSVERVHPAYAWFTPDYRLNNIGRSVFRLKRFSYGDIKRWGDMDVSGSEKVNTNINEFLSKYNEGGIIPGTLLFRNINPLVDIDYDVIVARGRFTKEYVTELGIEIPEIMKYDRYIPCEIYFSGNYVLRIKVMNVIDEHLGVYTTLFRRNGDSLFGYSVYDFTRPFAHLYENVIDSMDKSVGKAMGLILQVDTGVIDDADKYFRRDENGNIVLDISEDNIIEFDSTNAAFSSPNFKGFPITITDIPSNLDKLVPMLSLIIQEMERITKIPAMLTDGSNISSALRTTSNFNAAFEASNKVIQALLRESENRILEPSIQYIFDIEALAGRLSDELMELEPEILLSDTLSRDNNEKTELIQHLSILTSLRDIIPSEKFAAFVNTVGREVLNLDEDLIPNAGILRMQTPPEQVQGAVPTAQ